MKDIQDFGPDDLVLITKMGAVHIAKGALTFAEFSKRMVDDFGEKVRPHLQDLWEESRKFHDAVLLPMLKSEEKKPLNRIPVRGEPTARSRSKGLNLRRINTDEETKALIERRDKDLDEVIEADRASLLTPKQAIGYARKHPISMDDLRKGKPNKVPNLIWKSQLRNLHVSKSEQLQQAGRAYSLDPTPDNQAKFELLKVEQALAQRAARSAATMSSRELDLHKQMAEAFEKASAQDNTDHVADLFDPAKQPKTQANPLSSAYGKANKLVNADEAAAARTRIQNALRKPLGSVGRLVNGGWLQDARRLGLYHYEAGLRDFNAWAKHMRQETGGKLSDAQLRKVYKGLEFEAKLNVVTTRLMQQFRDAILEEGREDTDRIADKLAKVNPGDLDAINRIMREEAKIPFSKKMVALINVGRLSNPLTYAKILLSHIGSVSADLIVDMIAAMMDTALTPLSKSKARGIMTEGGGGHLMARWAAYKSLFTDVPNILRYGEKNAEYLGMKKIGDPTFDKLMDEAAVNNRVGQGWVDLIRRTHTATYRAPRVFAFTRAMQQIARLQAYNEGLRGAEFNKRVSALLDNPTDRMSADAALAADEAVYLNENRLQKRIQGLKLGASAPEQALVDFLLPFTRVSRTCPDARQSTRLGLHGKPAGLFET